MPKDMGLEWSISQEQIQPLSQKIRPKEFFPTPKEVSITREELRAKYELVKDSIQEWNIIPPTIMEMISNHLSTDNIIPSDHGHYQIGAYDAQDQITMDKNPGLEAALKQTFDYFDVELTPMQIVKLALEFDLSHELGHGLRAAIARKFTEKRLLHSGQLPTESVDEKFRSAQQSVDNIFLEQNPIPELHSTSNNPILESTSNERIAQSVSYAYFAKALLREGLGEEIARKIIQSMLDGTRESYKESLHNINHHLDKAVGVSELIDEKTKRDFSDAGYIFPVGQLELEKFIFSCT